MLNRAERFQILKHIRNYCIVGCLPAVVNLSSWQLIQNSITGRRSWPSLINFGLFVLHSLYQIGALLFSVCFSRNDASLHKLVVHALLALSAPILQLWYYQLYIRHPSAFAGFFQITLTGNIGGNTGRNKENVGQLNRHTLQDFVAINLRYMVALLVAVILAAGIHDPTLDFLLYAGLPKQAQMSLTFAALMLEEMRYLLMICALSVPVLILQIMSFDLVNNQLKILIGSINRTGSKRKLRRAYRSLRHIQLYIAVINVVNRYIIFSIKVASIAFCIGTGYAAIAHFGDYPVFGVMYYLLLINNACIYTVSYDKAFIIPRLFTEASERAVLALCRSGYGGLRILKRQMRSIPPVGVKVGEFHVLERESTPVFVHYVLSNIVTMLVAFRH